MNDSLTADKARRLERVVEILCPIVKDRLDASRYCAHSETALRRHLVACIVGSQVRQETATECVERLESDGLLEDRWWLSEDETFEAMLLDSLSGRSAASTGARSHRFPKARARQISGARDALVQSSISQRLESQKTARSARETLVREIPGLGPKQASMFLRNVGFSYDLAIIDTHVVRFFGLRNHASRLGTQLGTLRSYEKAERRVRRFAADVGYPVGYVDWAIWLTMRAARELQI